jgi:hypothetical protein
VTRAKARLVWVGCLLLCASYVVIALTLAVSGMMDLDLNKIHWIVQGAMATLIYMAFGFCTVGFWWIARWVREDFLAPPPSVKLEENPCQCEECRPGKRSGDPEATLSQFRVRRPQRES